MKINNDLVKAQELCHQAMDRLLPFYVKLAQAMEDSEYWTNIEVNIEPWNNGYQISMKNKKFNWEKLRHIGDGLGNLLTKIDLCNTMYILPTSLFSFESGSSYLEGRLYSYEEYTSYRSNIVTTYAQAQEEINDFVHFCIDNLKKAITILK